MYVYKYVSQRGARPSAAPRILHPGIWSPRAPLSQTASRRRKWRTDKLGALASCGSEPASDAPCAPERLRRPLTRPESYEHVGIISWRFGHRAFRPNATPGAACPSRLREPAVKDAAQKSPEKTLAKAALSISFVSVNRDIATSAKMRFRVTELPTRGRLTGSSIINGGGVSSVEKSRFRRRAAIIFSRGAHYL